jgi:ABC-2 type transport system permease protein
VIVVNRDAGSTQLESALVDALPVSYADEAASSEMNSMGEFLTEMLQSAGFEDLMNVTLMEDAVKARDTVDQQEAGVAILIPENFSQALTQPEEQAVVGFYYDPGLTLGPNIVKGILQEFLDRFSSSNISLQITFEQMAASGVPMDENTAMAVTGAYFQEFLGQAQVQDSSQLLNLRSASGEQVQDSAAIGIIPMMMTGMTVFYVFFNGASTAQSLLTEDEKGTLPRLFTTPTRQSTILGGKLLSGAVLIIVQITVLMLFGHLAFQIEWGQLATLLPMIITLTMVAVAFGIFLMSWVYTERQAGLMIGGVVTIMGMLGMLPIFTMGTSNNAQLVSTLSRLVPQGWAVDGLTIAMEGGLPADVLLNAAVLAGWAVLFFIIGVLRFARRFA